MLLLRKPKLSSITHNDTTHLHNSTTFTQRGKIHIDPAKRFRAHDRCTQVKVWDRKVPV